MRLCPRLYDKSRCSCPGVQNIHRRVLRGWGQVSCLGYALLCSSKEGHPTVLRLTPDSVSWVPFLNHAARALMIHRLWGLKQEGLSKAQIDAFDIDVELTREAWRLLVRVGLFGLIYFKVGGKRPLLHAIGFDLFLSLSTTAWGLDGNGYDVGLAEMFTPRRSSRKLSLPWFEVIVGKSGGVRWQWQTHMIPIGNLTANSLDGKDGDWLKALEGKVVLDGEKELTIRLMDLVGVSKELWPETLTDAQKEHLERASQQLWGAGTQDQQLSSDAFFSWMKEAELDQDYRRLMSQVAATAEVALDNSMDIVGLIEGLDPSNGRIRQVLLSQLFGGRTDVMQFIVSQVQRGGEEFIKSSCNKEEVAVLQKQVEKLKRALAKVADSVTDKKFLVALHKGRKSDQNLGQIVASFARDKIIAPAIAEISTAVNQNLTRQAQCYLQIAQIVSTMFDVSCLVSHVLPQGMLELDKRQSQVATTYKAVPQLKQPDYAAHGSWPFGKWLFQAQNQIHTSDETTVKTSAVSAKVCLGPCSVKLQYAGGSPVGFTIQQRISNGGPSVSLPTLQQVIGWIQGEHQDKALDWMQRVRRVVMLKVRDMVGPMLDETSGQVVRGKFRIKALTEIAGGDIQVTSDNQGTVIQVGGFGADLAPEQLPAIAKECTQLKQQRLQLDGRGQTQSMVAGATSRRAAATAQRVQLLNPMGARFAIASNKGEIQRITGMFNTSTHGVGGTVVFGPEGQFSLQDLQLRGPLFYLLARLQQEHFSQTLGELQDQLKAKGAKGLLKSIVDKLTNLTDPSQVKALLDGVGQDPKARLALKDIGSVTEVTPIKKLVDVLKAHGVNLDKKEEIKPEDIKNRFTSVNLQRCLTVLLAKYKESGNSSYLKLLHLVQRAAATSVAEKTLSIGKGEKAFDIKMPQVWTLAERVAYSKVVKQRLQGGRVVIRRDPTSVAALFVDEE